MAKFSTSDIVELAKRMARANYKQKLKPGYYLVKCPGWNKAGYTVSYWNGKYWDDPNDIHPINNFVTHYSPIDQIKWQEVSQL